MTGNAKGGAMGGPFTAPAGALRTARLDLVPFGPGDAPAIFGYARQPGFFAHLDEVPEAVQRDYRLEHAQAHLDELLQGAAAGYPNWSIRPLRLQGRVVGSIRFHERDGHADLGYAVDPRHWGQGIASEAGATVVAWARAHARPGARLTARCAPGNAASARVLARLGFARAGADGRGRLLFQLP